MSGLIFFRLAFILPNGRPIDSAVINSNDEDEHGDWDGGNGGGGGGGSGSGGGEDDDDDDDDELLLIPSEKNESGWERRGSL